MKNCEFEGLMGQQKTSDNQKKKPRNICPAFVTTFPIHF